MTPRHLNSCSGQRKNPANPPAFLPPHHRRRKSLATPALAAITLAALTTFPAPLHADIFRWDNGQLIPGTQGLTPAPGVDLASLTLQYASLSLANLTGASLQSADLTAAILTSANLSSADLSDANLTSATLLSANLTSANLAGAILHFTNLAYCHGLTAANLYSTASYQAHDLTGLALRGASAWNLSSQNLTSADFQSALLASAGFISANLTSANFFNADLTSVDFTGAIIRGANFQADFFFGFGPSASQIYSTASYAAHDLTAIRLAKAAGWDLSSQNLTSAYLFFVDLTSAKLTSANLTSAALGHALFTSADLTGAILHGADLRYATGLTAAQFYSTASYQNHDLTGISFPDATGWDLSSQNLSSAYLASATLASANLASATLFKANLISANLTSANLTGANLQSANLTNANLTSANFSLADLRGSTNFTPAASTLVRGVIASNATVQPFSLLPGDTFRIRAGSPVTFTGSVAFSTNTALVIDAGATVNAATTLDLPVASSLQVQGQLTVPAIAITLDGGTLSGYGTISGVINAGIVPHKIAPSSGHPPTNTGTLTAASLATNVYSTLAFNLISPGTSDQINITSTNGLTLVGGTIQVANAPTGPASLGYYKILQYSGAVQGTGPKSLILPATQNNIAYSLDTSHDPGFIDLHRGFLGDANDDASVNFADFALLSNNFGHSNATWSTGDFNGDGLVNAADFTLLAAAFGTSLAPLSAPSTPSTPTPEPASLFLLAPLALLLPRRRPS